MLIGYQKVVRVDLTVELLTLCLEGLRLASHVHRQNRAYMTAEAFGGGVLERSILLTLIHQILLFTGHVLAFLMLLADSQLVRLALDSHARIQ